jgi:nitrous oxide reductase accessory protein NosL
MKKLKFILGIVLLTTLAAGTINSRADNQKPKPYPLKTCLVCSMELGMMGGKPFVFVYKGQEIKLCDASEKELFDKAPDKYMKKLADAVGKLKK